MKTLFQNRTNFKQLVKEEAFTTNINDSSMQALLQAATEPHNIVFTTLLIVVLLYWMSVIIGALDMSFLDFDLEVDAEVDAELDVEMETEGEVAHGAGWFAGALQFFNFGRLPFMIVISFLVVSMWSISILLNHYYGQGSTVFALAMVFPNICVSLFITKLLTTPLIPLFENLDGSVDPVDYIGETCRVILPASSTQVGQAEVEVENNYLLINIKVREEEAKPVLKGEEALIIGEEENGNYYWVKHISMPNH